MKKTLLIMLLVLATAGLWADAFMGIQSSLVDDDHYEASRNGIKIGYVPGNSKIGVYATYQQGTKLNQYNNEPRHVKSFGLGPIYQCTSFLSFYAGIESITIKVQSSIDACDNFNLIGACIGTILSAQLNQKSSARLYISPGIHTYPNYGFSLGGGIGLNF